LTQRPTPINVDDKLVGNCPNGSFFYIDVAPKKLAVSSKLWDLYGTSTIKFTPQTGATYYIQIAPRDEQVTAAASTVEPDIDIQQGGAFSLHVIKEEAALRLLPELDYASTP
jgi:hypothetical protein